MNQQPTSASDRLLDLLVQKGIENANRRTEPANQMRTEIKEMYDLIRGTRSFSGFALMGAQTITFDNSRTLLQWKMGEGSKVDFIQFFYDYGSDTYKLRFVTYNRNDSDKIETDLTHENLYAEDVRPLIERATGFYLTIF